MLQEKLHVSHLWELNELRDFKFMEWINLLLLTLILIFVLTQAASSTSNDASNNNQCLQACLKGSFCSSLNKGPLEKGPAKNYKGESESST